MKFQISVLVLFTFILSLQLHSQTLYFPIQNELFAPYDTIIYNHSTLFHTSIKPYRFQQHTELFQIYTPRFSTSNMFLNDIVTAQSYQSRIGEIKISATPVLTATAGAGTSLVANAEGGFSLNVTYKKISFQSITALSEIRYPNYLNNNVILTERLPHFGKYLNENALGYFYLYFSGYLNFRLNQFVETEIGNGKNFWGDGYRSLFLSDNAANYPYMKFSFDFWKIKYVWLATFLTDYDSSAESETPVYAAKNSVCHYFSWNIGKRFNINAFETIIWNPVDTLGHRGYDINYLNPVAFYRPVEFMLGSSDNALLGAGFRAKVTQNVHLYGQGILDDFAINQLRKRNGWWGNKFGIQLGFKWFTPFQLQNWYAQGEMNYVRPFTYAHHFTLQNFGHYYQPLAHPLGANFKEVIGILRYHKDRKLITAKAIVALTGSDENDTISNGGNIYKSYNLRVSEYGIETGQGVKNTILYGELKYSYLLNRNWNLYFETVAALRFQKIEAENVFDAWLSVGFKTLIYNNE